MTQPTVVSTHIESSDPDRRHQWKKTYTLYSNGSVNVARKAWDDEWNGEPEYSSETVSLTDLPPEIQQALS